MSSLLTRPLPLFYAVEAIAKAVAIVLDPALDGTNFKAHGLQGVKQRHYVIRALSCKVQAPGSDVWSRICAVANLDLVKLGRTVDGTAQVTDHVNRHGTVPYAAGREIALGELLRQLPEIAEDIPSSGMRHPYVVHVSRHRLEIDSTNRTGYMRCTFRHAHVPDTRDMIIDHECGNGLLRQFRRVRDVFDVLEYESPRIRQLKVPDTRSDVFGRLYMNFVRTRSYLGELPLHFAALFTLSDAVRYQGQWQKLLADHPEEEVLVDRYLDVAVRKLPNLALNHLTGHFHRFTNQT